MGSIQKLNVGKVSISYIFTVSLAFYGMPHLTVCPFYTKEVSKVM